ncbi:MAG: hypothetical protein LBS79_05365 [Tannerella sp.]|jgi:hypothetical protein|nr:hypothetical protein [Tannerella sp.]
MIRKFEKIPVTVASHPYGTAEKKCDFARRGFVEEEFFMHGTANVYGTVDGKTSVVYSAAPYVNRFVVRRPVDQSRFSGNIIVEILNSTSWIDIDRMWVISKEKFMRDGDTYIGITSKPNTIPVMKKLDPKRYEALSWANPRKATKPAEELGNLAGASSPETEDGLFWDMLIDLAEVLRDRGRTPIEDSEKARIFLTGWSQSGGYMLRFVNTFAYKDPREVPLFDGYFAAGAACIAYPGLNQEESRPWSSPDNFSNAVSDAPVPWRLGKHYQPYIDVHTESENSGLGTKEARCPDSDDSDFPYRAYDIPGASHDTWYNMVEYFKNDPDLFTTGIFPAYGGREPLANDYPYEFIFNAAYQMLFDWVNKGIVPPRISLIELDGAANDNKRDEHGNALGGWRTAFVDYPACTYYKRSTPLTPFFTFGCGVFGYKVLFGAEKMKRLYGSLDTYRTLVEEMAGRQVTAKQLLPGDHEAYIKRALEYARQAGL